MGAPAVDAWLPWVTPYFCSDLAAGKHRLQLPPPASDALLPAVPASPELQPLAVDAATLAAGVVGTSGKPEALLLLPTQHIRRHSAPPAPPNAAH